MENKLEQLLNSLIQKGFRPFDMEATRIEYRGGPEFLLRYKGRNKNGGGWNVRNLASKESGLWQFVCENHLYIFKMGENKNFIQDHFKNEYNECCYKYLYDKSCYEYYLLESSLKDESELEEFLLNSIKID